MKKLFFIAVLITIIVFSTTAGTFGMGAKLGSPISWASGSGWQDTLDLLDDVSNSPGFGVTTGLYFTYEFTQNIAIQAETLVGLYVWGAEGTDTGQTYSLNLQLFLVEFPLMVKVMLPLWKGAVTFQAGPDFFYGIGRVDTSYEIGGVPTESSFDPEPRLFFGATAGIGYELYLKKWLIGIETRYTRTFTSFTEGSNPIADDMYINALNINLAIGYRF